MKRFSLPNQLIFWLLVAIIGIGLLSGFYAKVVAGNSLQQQKERLFSDNTVRFPIWVMGDSHPLLGFDPKQVGGSFNWAGTSENYALNYFKISHLLKSGYKPDHILLSAEYHGLSAQGMGLLKNHELDDCYWVNRISISQFVKEINDPTLFRWWIAARFVPFAGQYYTVFNALFKENQIVGPFGFMPDPTVFDSSLNKSNELKYKVLSHTKEHQMIDSIQVLYLQKIKKLCRENQIRLTMVRYPIHPQYHQMLARYANLSQIDSVYSIVLKDVPFWNFSRIFDQKTALFSDPDHLNQAGAEAFTRMIQDSVFAQPAKGL